MKFIDFKKGMVVKWIEQITNITIYAKIIDVNSEKAEYLVLNKTPTHISGFNKNGFEKGYYVSVTPVEVSEYKKIIQELKQRIKESNSYIKDYNKKIKSTEGDINQYQTIINDLNQKK